MQKVKCRISDVSLKDQETLFIDIKAEQEFQLNDFEELTEAIKELGKGKRMYKLFNVGKNTIPNKEVREISCVKHNEEFKKAEAYVLKSLSQRIVADLMLRINKPSIPTKFFDRIEDAEKWLLSLRIQEVFSV